MDYLDPHKQRAHGIRLIIGYILIGLAIIIATSILLYRAYGFGFGQDGAVVQNGLVFVSSQPDNAEIYLDDKKYKSNTGARIQLPAGQYGLKVQKKGYTQWQRTVSVAGGSVDRYDYPMLLPSELTPETLKTYESQPQFASASPDRRWLLVSQPAAALNFDVYDFSNPEQITENLEPISLPAGILSASTTGTHSWKLVEWSTDNRHVVLEHAYDGGTEYILVDRAEPQSSQNLTRTLQLVAGQVLSLRDKKFDNYYIYSPAERTVASATLSDGFAPTPVLTDVLGFKSYGEDILLYATDVDAPAGKAVTMLRDGDVTYKIREHGLGGPYLLDLARYDGDWYVAVGSSADDKVYVFRNPQDVRKTGRVDFLVPVQILKVDNPNYMAFSSNTRFIMVVNGVNFAIYDAETDDDYSFTASSPLDPENGHATWMDGHRITYVSGGQHVMFDYDNINQQILVAGHAKFLPFYDRDYRYLYTLSPAESEGQSNLVQTPLLIEADR